jgi:hypothetical protein
LTEHSFRKVQLSRTAEVQYSSRRHLLYSTVIEDSCSEVTVIEYSCGTAVIKDSCSAVHIYTVIGWKRSSTVSLTGTHNCCKIPVHNLDILRSTAVKYCYV